MSGSTKRKRTGKLATLSLSDIREKQMSKYNVGSSQG